MEPERNESTIRSSLIDARFFSQAPIGLGFFDVTVGIAKCFMPGALLKLSGLKQIGTGTAVLAYPDRAQFLWASAAGHALDAVGFAIGAKRKHSKLRFAAAVECAAVAALAADLARRAGSVETDSLQRAVRASAALTVHKPVDEVYGYWHNFENLPNFMDHLESVDVIDLRRSRWKAKAPAGQSVEWEAEIITDEPNHLISWQSAEGSQISNAGSVRFTPNPDNSTNVHVELAYEVPGGLIGARVARLFGEEPQQQIEADLRRFSDVVERS